MSYGFASTRLKLTSQGTTDDARFTKHAVSASLDRRVGDRWTLGGAVGATLVGTLDVAGRTYDLSPGPMLTFAASYRALDEGDVAPFVLLTASLGAALGWTSPVNGSGSESMLAFDGRIGVAAGKTIAHAVTPYLLARAFGLPILWHDRGADVTGTDAYHYQLGAGVVARWGRFDVSVEGVPFGERAIVGGAGVAF